MGPFKGKRQDDRPSADVNLIRETEKAWLLELPNGVKEWFPKSQGELYKHGDSTYTLHGEEWIMKDKGMI